MYYLDAKSLFQILLPKRHIWTKGTDKGLVFFHGICTPKEERRREGTEEEELHNRRRNYYLGATREPEAKKMNDA